MRHDRMAEDTGKGGFLVVRRPSPQAAELFSVASGLNVFRDQIWILFKEFCECQEHRFQHHPLVLAAVGRMLPTTCKNFRNAGYRVFCRELQPAIPIFQPQCVIEAPALRKAAFCMATVGFEM